MKTKRIFVSIICALIFLCLLIFSGIFLAPQREVFPRTAFMVLLFGGGGLFTILGIILTILTVKKKIKGKLKVFLLLTGISAPAFLVGTVSHNMLYALGTVVEHIKILHSLIGVVEAIFFLIAIPGSPLVFIVGVIGSLILLAKK